MAGWDKEEKRRSKNEFDKLYERLQKKKATVTLNEKDLDLVLEALPKAENYPKLISENLELSRLKAQAFLTYLNAKLEKGHEKTLQELAKVFDFHPEKKVSKAANPRGPSATRRKQKSFI